MPRESGIGHAPTVVTLTGKNRHRYLQLALLPSRSSTTGVPTLIRLPVKEWTSHVVALLRIACARAVERDGRRGGYCDGPADACETVATVNVAMFDATGVESDGGVGILGGRALS